MAVEVSDDATFSEPEVLDDDDDDDAEKTDEDVKVWDVKPVAEYAGSISSTEECEQCNRAYWKPSAEI